MKLHRLIYQPILGSLSLLMVASAFACDTRTKLAEVKRAPQATASPATSSDDLLQQYQRLAASTDAKDQQALLDALKSKEFIYRLDTHDEHARQPVSKLRLAKLFQAMMANDTPATRATLVALARSGQPTDCDACDELLIKALAIVRPATPEVIAFWEKQSHPDSIQLEFTIEALCANGSVPALTLLEKRMADTKIAPELKTAWMRRAMLPHRRSASLLAVEDRMLNTSLPNSLRPALVEAIFDYRPQEWYRNDRNPPVPDARPLTPETKRLLQKIGATALKKVSLNANQRRTVTKALSELK